MGSSSILFIHYSKDNYYKEPVLSSKTPIAVSSYPRDFRCFMAPCLQLCEVAPAHMTECNKGPAIIDVSEISIIAPRSPCCVDRFDPWGNYFHVDCSGPETRVFSAGLDGVEGTEDDLKCSCNNPLYKGE